MVTMGKKIANCRELNSTSYDECGTRGATVNREP
jgi:hypothetical protein